MFGNLFNLGNLVGMYSGSPLTGAALNGVQIPISSGMSSGVFAVSFILGLALSVFIIITWWKIFTKAGRPGWAAIIPVYNLIVMFKIAGVSPLWLLLIIGSFIPFVNFVTGIAYLVVTIIMYVKLAKAFGKSGWFAVGMILLGVIFLPILAFGKATYTGIAPAAPIAPQNPPVPPTPQVESVPPVVPTGTV